MSRGGEILQLKLNSDLVVLSSCRSGLGEIDEAEGVVECRKRFF
ncbi:MAG: CHAT domain-containing protein [Ignavibacteriales bacterium]|nr:CHAT domain-containing protein [Ignavibacteriales bacterium]